MTKANRKNVTALMSNARTAGDELRRGIQDLRDHIETLRDRREEILKLPVALPLAEKRIDEWVTSQVSGARSTATRPEHFVSSREGWTPPRFALVDSLVIALANQAAQALKEDLRTLYENMDCIDEADRQVEIAKLDEEMLDAELAEEGIIRTAEAAGFPVRRRADADPRAVLAVDEVLP